MDDNARRCKRKRDLQLDDAFLYGGGVVAELLRSEFLYGGGVVAEVLRSEITRVRVGPHVKDIPSKAFKGCTNLVTPAPVPTPVAPYHRRARVVPRARSKLS